jgi:hypothetical protein
MPDSTAQCTRHNRRRHQPDLSPKSPSLDPSSFLTLPSYPVASPCRPPRPPSSPSPVIVPFFCSAQPGTQSPVPPETYRNLNRTEPNPKPTSREPSPEPGYSCWSRKGDPTSRGRSRTRAPQGKGGAGYSHRNRKGDPTSRGRSRTEPPQGVKAGRGRGATQEPGMHLSKQQWRAQVA